MSSPAAQFAEAWGAYGLEPPVREYRFDADRKFRFDFAWVKQRTAVEIEGGTWGHSRHTSGRGYATDVEKYNLATLGGWKVVRFTTSMLKHDPDGCVELVIDVMNGTRALEVQP